MQRLVTALITVALAIALSGGAAIATDASRTSYVSTGLAGHPEPRTSHVLDVTFDRVRGAMEHHQVGGAGPDTTYALVASIFFAPDCNPVFGVVEVPEGMLATDGNGNGRAVVRFPGSALAGAPATFWVEWSLKTDAGTAYRTGCVRVDLD